MPKFGFIRRRWFIAIAAVLFLAVVLPAPILYSGYKSGRLCSSCHEIWEPYNDWHTSAHRDIPCSECHGSVMTLHTGFHLNNMRRVFNHLGGNVSEKPHLRTADVLAMTARCQNCHRADYANWLASRHSAGYKDVFLNEKHNTNVMLMDDCLRCHGTHFEGPVRDLVAPISRKGPWQLKRADLADMPVVPCLECHRLHNEGTPHAKSNMQSTPGPQQAITISTLAFYDRRTQEHVPVMDLPLPQMLDGERAVKIAPDQRQALCYQCHAPRPDRQVASGDDRTPIGVHEGLSCFACHANGGAPTRASCSNCHPKLSNCGIDVEKMDTSFKDKANSKHNIHFVKCTDCHTHGVPKKKMAAVVAAVAAK